MSAVPPRIPTSASFTADPITAAAHVAPARTGAATAATPRLAGRSASSASHAPANRSWRLMASIRRRSTAAKASSRAWARSSTLASMSTPVSRAASLKSCQARSYARFSRRRTSAAIIAGATEAIAPKTNHVGPRSTTTATAVTPSETTSATILGMACAT